MNARKELLGGLAAIILSAWIVLGSFSIAFLQTGVNKIAGVTASQTSLPTATSLPTVLPGTPSPTPAPTLTPTRTHTPPPPPNCPPPAGWKAYTASQNDTLAGLAQQYGTTVTLLMQKNCMAVSNLLPDMIIFLPPQVPTTTPTPSVSPTIILIATFTRSATPCGPSAGWIAYVVKSGDTLSKLARLLNVTVYQLQVGNCLGNADLIFTGQTIYIPHALPNTPTPTDIPSTQIIPSKTSTLTTTPTATETATFVTDTPTPTPTATEVISTPTQTPTLTTTAVIFTPTPTPTRTAIVAPNTTTPTLTPTATAAANPHTTTPTPTQKAMFIQVASQSFLLIVSLLYSISPFHHF